MFGSSYKDLRPLNVRNKVKVKKVMFALEQSHEGPEGGVKLYIFFFRPLYPRE
jgi:hypothetical protein